MSVLSGSRPVARRTGTTRRAPRRKRSYKSAADRRRQILDCALSAFAERGYHETSIADICDRAAIGRATLYQYFADKRDLLVALADEIVARVTLSLDEREPLRIPSGFQPTEAQTLRFIEERFASVLEVVFEDPDTTRLVLRAGRGADGVVDEVLQRLDRAVLGRIEAELDHAKEAGVIRPVDSAFVARFFLGGIEKIVLSYVEEGRPLDVRAVAKEAALLEVFGIHTRTDTPR